jgi:hypothetical protein
MEIVPNTHSLPNNEKDSMKNLAEFVYPDLKNKFAKKGWMKGRAVLAPTNSQVNEINNQLLGWSLTLVFLSKLVEHTLCLEQLQGCLFQPLYTSPRTNLRVTYSGQTRGWSETRAPD